MAFCLIIGLHVNFLESSYMAFYFTLNLELKHRALRKVHGPSFPPSFARIPNHCRDAGWNGATSSNRAVVR